MNKRTELYDRVCQAILAEGAIITSTGTLGSNHRHIDFQVGYRSGRCVISSTPRQGKDLNAITGARREVRKLRI
jgi:hypothetical protein